MARRPRAGRRDVDGVLLLDKPPGWTSNAALQHVKRLFGAVKAGHTGSLDPLASGLLPICLGEATKVSTFLLDADKHYLVTCRLGIKTDTGDADGHELARAPAGASVERTALLAALAATQGLIEQVPPMHSALKHEGKRLYALARAGIEVERAPRQVRIHSLKLLALDADGFTLDVRCSKGTYVRTLIEDLAEGLGSYAHVTVLRRLGVGPYAEEGMTGMVALEAAAEAGTDAIDALLLPIDSAAAQWPSVRLGADSAYYLCNGQPVLVPRAPTHGLVRLYAEDDRFLGMGCITQDGRVAPKRLVRTASPSELVGRL